jgi:hypothetical protein
MKYSGCYRSHVNAIPEMTTEQQAVPKIRIGLQTQTTTLLEQRGKGNGSFWIKVTFSVLNMMLVVCWDRAEDSVVSSADVWRKKSNQNIQRLSMTLVWYYGTIRLTAVCNVMLSYCYEFRYVELLLCVPLCWVTAVCVVMFSYCCVHLHVELLLCVPLCLVTAVCTVMLSYCCV